MRPACADSKGLRKKLLIEKWDVLGWRGLRKGLQKGVDVRELGVGDGLGSVGRHLAGGLPDVCDETRKGTLGRPETSTTGLDGALALEAVALVTTEGCVEASAVL